MSSVTNEPPKFYVECSDGTVEARWPDGLILKNPLKEYAEWERFDVAEYQLWRRFNLLPPLKAGDHVDCLLIGVHLKSGGYGAAEDDARNEFLREQDEIADYDARAEPDEYSAPLDCGCLLNNLDDGGSSFKFCDAHAKALEPELIESSIFRFATGEALGADSNASPVFGLKGGAEGLIPYPRQSLNGSRGVRIHTDHQSRNREILIDLGPVNAHSAPANFVTLALVGPSLAQEREPTNGYADDPPVGQGNVHHLVVKSHRLDEGSRGNVRPPELSLGSAHSNSPSEKIGAFADGLDLVQLPHVEAVADLQLNRLESELRLVTPRMNVHMRRFTPFVAVEAKAIASHPQHRWHYP